MPNDSSAEFPPTITRRDALKVAGAAGLALTRIRDLAAEEASPPASPVAEGMSPSPIEGVPNAYWQYPEATTTVDANAQPSRVPCQPPGAHEARVATTGPPAGVAGRS